MKQGEIWQVDLNPVKGSEQAGNRPVVIISGNLMNTYLNVVIACPLTSKIKNYKGNVVLTPSKANGLQQISEILTFHIRSISKERFVKKIGTIQVSEVAQIHECLNDILKM
jgi:mRNA interferase MazF